MNRLRQLTGHVGRRGGFLLFLAMLDAVYAWALVIQGTTTNRLVPQQDYLLPWQVWAGVWAGAGLIVFIGAFLVKDVWAYTAAAMNKTAWGSLSLVLWVQGRQPNGWLSGVVWLTFAGTVLMVASWPEYAAPRTGFEPPEIGGRE